MAGVILQDRDTQADLEQVSKFNSTNQNMCSDTPTYPGVFSDWELSSKTYLGKTLSLRESFAHTNSDSNILATAEKADWVDFLERIALHLRGSMKIKVDSRVPYNVKR